MFDQNWLKRYMLANQGGAGGPQNKGLEAPPVQLPPRPLGLPVGGTLPPTALQGQADGESEAPMPQQPATAPQFPRIPSAAPSELPVGQFPRATSMAQSDAGRRPFGEPVATGAGGDAAPPLAALGLGPCNPTPNPNPAIPPWPPGAFGSPSPWNLQDGVVRHYVVMCRDDVEIRASPTYSDDARIGHFLHPGQVIVVDDRRMIQGAWYLHLADGRGWAFETKDRLLVMTEAHGFERGLWHYSIVCEDDVETRMTPTYSDDMRTGMVLASGDCIAVDERCSIAGARFLKLADGRGWAFETKDRLVVMSEVRAHVQEPRDFARGLWHYTVVCDDDVEIRAGPTYSDEARTGLMLHPGDCIPVDERCRVGAAWFLRLADGRGWVFETKDSRHVMAQLR